MKCATSRTTLPFWPTLNSYRHVANVTAVGVRVPPRVSAMKANLGNKSGIATDVHAKNGSILFDIVAIRDQ